MARVLIGWEFGGGHGHAVNMVAVGRALVARGHDVVLAVRDPQVAWAVTRDSGLPVLQAPMSRALGAAMTGGKPFRARSMLDILAMHGYGDPVILESTLASWRHLVDVVRPDFVLAEFAPLLCMATSGRVPNASFGIGFCLPCLDASGAFPVFEPSASALLPPQRVIDNIAAVMDRAGIAHGANPLASLIGDAQFAIGLDEIDPYRDARTAPGLGPLWSTQEAVRTPTSTPSCFVYLPGEHMGMDLFVEGLKRLRMPGIAYIRGASRRTLDALRSTTLEVSATPVDIGAVLSRVSVVFHHGGTGTVERCLAWGVPQVLAPMVLEQELTGRLLTKMNVGRVLQGPEGARRAGDVMEEVARAAPMAEAASRVAGELRNKYRQGSLDALVDACVARMGGA